MKKEKPAIGYKNMRKVTHNEAKLLGLNKKIMIKILIMITEEDRVTFWIKKNKTDEVVPFTGSDDEYFDDKRASDRLKQYWGC